MTTATAEPTATDYGALLDDLENNELAWLANRMTDAETGATWPSRAAAIDRILAAHEQMPERDHRSTLLMRYFLKRRNPHQDEGGALHTCDGDSLKRDACDACAENRRRFGTDDAPRFSGMAVYQEDGKPRLLETRARHWG